MEPQKPPPRIVDIRMGVGDVCPVCKSQDTTLTVSSYYRVYCRCSDCGHIWHQSRATH